MIVEVKKDKPDPKVTGRSAENMGNVSVADFVNQAERGLNIQTVEMEEISVAASAPLLSMIGDLSPHITGSKKQIEERAALFDVRVHVIIR